MKNTFAIFAALVVASVSTLAAPVLVTDGIAASVNGDQITIAEVVRQMRPYLENSRRKLGRLASEDAVFVDAYKAALKMVEDTRIVLQLYRAGEMRIPPYAVDRMATETLEKRYGGNFQALQSDLAKERLTYTEWKEQLEERLIVMSMRRTYVDDNARVSPREVQAYYDAHKVLFATTTSSIVHIAAMSNEEIAEQFRQRVDGGEDFEVVAKELSTEAMAGSGGNYGRICPKEDLAPVVASALEFLEDGVLSEPFAFLGKQYIVRKTDTKIGQIRELAEVWDEIEHRLVEQKQEQLFEKWISHLRETSEIKEYMGFLESTDAK